MPIEFSTLSRLKIVPSHAIPSPTIDRYQCRVCAAFHLGQSLLRPQSCSACGVGTLLHIGIWELWCHAWPQIQGEMQL